MTSRELFWWFAESFFSKSLYKEGMKEESLNKEKNVMIRHIIISETLKHFIPVYRYSELYIRSLKIGVFAWRHLTVDGSIVKIWLSTFRQLAILRLLIRDLSREA